MATRAVLVRAGAAALTLATALSVAAVVPAVGASADVGHQITSAQDRLTALDRQAEVIANRYDAARIDLSRAEQGAAAAQARVAQADARVTALQNSIGAFASAAYVHEGVGDLALLTESSPQNFLDRSDALEQVARSQQETLDAMAAARHDLASAQADAARALTAQRQVSARISADRAQITRAVAQQEAILRQLREKQAAIERAARLAAARARAAAARAAALRAAQEAAARAAAYDAQMQAYREAASTFANQPVSGGPAPSGSGGAATAVHWAYAELGKPYVWGAAGPDSFDCSGLTQYVWGKAGVYLDHYTGSQWNEGRHVSVAELQPGDLVFFGSDLHHVGIYIGNGEMIDAPHTGANVRIDSAFWSDYAGAVRPQG